MTESRSFFLNYFKILGILVEHIECVHQSDEHKGSSDKKEHKGRKGIQSHSISLVENEQKETTSKN